MKSICYLVWTVLILTNVLVALVKNCAIIPIVIGGAISIGFGWILLSAISSGTITTKQDGCISKFINPLKYWVIFSLIASGCILGLVAPWLL